MPIYEYFCAACGRRSSALLPSYSSPDPACAHCGEAGVKRLVSTFATVRGDSAEIGSDFGEDAYDGGGDDFGGDFDAGGMEGFGEDY